jgi:glycosyltransferase involved in cell wall biosynthesis
MHILMVNAHGHDITAGGVEKGIAMLSDGLVRRGHSVAFLNAFPGGRVELGMDVTVVHDEDWRGHPVRRLRNHVDDVVSHPSAAAADVIARIRPDVVHTHNLPGISTGVWEVSRRQSVPVMHTMHDYHLLCPRTTMMRRDGTTPCRPHPLLCGLRTRRLTRWAGAVSQLAAVSRHLLAVHEHLFPEAVKRVVRNPMVLPAPLRPVRPPAQRLASIGYIGNLDVVKGVHVLLAAAPALQAVGCELHIAGTGRLKDEVAAAAERWPFVHYHGVVSGPTKDAFLESCDAGIIPSVWAEPGGPTHTLIEWVCSGRPVLVSGRGGLGEVVDLYPAAIRVDPTVDGITSGIVALAGPPRWNALLSSLEPIDTRGELARWVHAHEEIYTSMLRSPSRNERLPR